MSNMKWTIDSERAYNNLVVSDDAGNVVAQVICEDENDAQGKANALLIAAAPAMLAFIRSLPPPDAPDFKERYSALLNGPGKEIITRTKA